MKMNRSSRVDLLKGIAILAVVSYHFQSVLPFGYLGVEIFLVISGYFAMQSIMKDVRLGTFSWWNFLVGRAVRLWPMVLFTALVSLAVGYVTMLPDDFENAAQQVIASNFFANNILACITTKNYWDIVNLYKPLMHTWYLGVLMQAYVLIATGVFVVTKLCKKNPGKVISVGTLVVAIVSLVLYILPFGSDAWKFYYLPWRIFEILAGGLIACIPAKILDAKGQRLLKLGQGIGFLFIFAALCINAEIVPSSVRLIAVVMSTAFLLLSFRWTEEKACAWLKPISAIGKASFSVYLCHQPIVAFMFYSVTDTVNIWTFLGFAAVVAVVSTAFYFLGEQPLGKLVKNKQIPLLVTSIVVCIALCGISGLIYLNAGVVRDVPELGISTQNVYRGMHAQYCDRPYRWDKDFESEDKVKVLVIGDSFGRDWANILSESDIADSLEISYIFSGSGEMPANRQARIDAADIVFWSTSSGNTDIIDRIAVYGKNYIVGYKNFGTSNGLIYSKRHTDNYYSLTIKLDEQAIKNNDILKQHYGEYFIDMIAVVQNDDGRVRAFTDTGHYISQDCRHLTQEGAIYYAKQMDLSWLLSKER